MQQRVPLCDSCRLITAARCCTPCVRLLALGGCRPDAFLDAVQGTPRSVQSASVHVSKERGCETSSRISDQVPSTPDERVAALLVPLA